MSAPTPTCDRAASGPGLASTLLRLLRPHGLLWSIVFLLVLVQAASHLATPVYYKLIFDRVISGGEAGSLATLVAGMAVVFAVMVATELVQARLCADLGMRATAQLRMALFEAIQRLAIDFLGSARSGDILNRFASDIGAIERVVSVSLYKVAVNALVTLLCVAALFFVEWHLAVFTLLILPFVALAPRIAGRQAAAAGHARREDDGRLTSAVQEMLAAHRVIRAFSIEGHHRRRFRALLDEVHAAGRRANFLNALVEKSSNLGIILAQLVIIALGAYLVTRRLMTAGDLVAFFGLLINASGALSALTTYLPDFVQASAASHRLDELLAQASPPQERHLVAAPRLAQEIRFEDVSFSYGEGTAVERVSFTIRAGQSVALVGRSGSGKSTILNLLMRFHVPTAGRIIVDGVDLMSIDPVSLRAQIGCVFQSTFLFDATVRENIRQGRLDASDDAVEQAARLAALHEFILDLPRGYDTRVGEAGGRLSGGQQQRLALARAILREPTILMLDEPTSALDPATEADVNQTLDALAAGRTRILVTHRLAAAVAMDQILVFDKGHLVECGTHDDLLQRDGAYGSMWKKQSHFVVDASGTRAQLNTMFLQTVPIFEELDTGLIDSLADQFSSELHEAGVKIIEQGEWGEKFYVIVRGRVEVAVRKSVQPTVQASWILEEGDFFGEIALLTNLPRTATIRSLDRCLLLTLTRAQFQGVVARAPHLRARFDKVVAQRLASASGEQ